MPSQREPNDFMDYLVENAFWIFQNDEITVYAHVLVEYQSRICLAKKVILYTG